MDYGILPANTNSRINFRTIFPEIFPKLGVPQNSEGTGNGNRKQVGCPARPPETEILRRQPQIFEMS